MSRTLTLDETAAPSAAGVSTQTTATLVSVGLPVYNEARHLRAALDALLAQDYDNFEIVISDNASTDATAEICAEYAARDRRIRYHRNETNVGGVNNFNRAFELARGEFFLWAAGHDLRHPAFLSQCVRVLAEEPAVVLCHALAAWIDEEGQVLEPIHSRVDTRGMPDRLARLNAVLWGLTTGFPIYGMMRAGALRRTRMYRQVVSPDIALLAELSLVGEFAHVPELLLYARRPADYGDWDVYVRKHFEGCVGGWSAQRLFWRMVGELLRSVARHVRSPAGKAAGAASVLLCVFVKYRWMLLGLLSLRRRGGV